MTFERLAIHGGAPAFPEGPPGWPIADPAVSAALAQAFSTGDWGRYHGPHCELLAARLAEMHQAESAQLCCSGTIAVELALRGFQLDAGAEVLLAGYDFPGNFRAIEAVGARPVLVDLEPGRWTLAADTFAAAISQDTQAAIVSHLHGDVADMQALTAIARKAGVRILEDACQNPGAIVQGRPAGAWGDASVLSFGGSKLLTAGRGGAVLSSDRQLMQRITIFRERGNDAFAMSELQACVLPPQLDALSERNARRAERVARLLDQIADLDCLRPVASRANCSAAYYKAGFLYVPEACGKTPRATLIAAAQAEGLALDAGFRGFAGRGARRCRVAGSLNHARLAASNTLVWHHPLFLENEHAIDTAAAALRQVVHALRG